MQKNNNWDRFKQTPYREIPELELSTLNFVSQKFGIADVTDFDPSGDMEGKNIPWRIISQAVLVRDNYACRICGANTMGEVDSSRRFDKLHFNLEVHHIIPRKDGGRDTLKNLITLCESCHHRTFSKDYAGIPVEALITLDSFYGNSWVIIPSEFTEFKKNNNAEHGALYDYGIVFDPLEGTRTVHPFIGQKIIVSLIMLSFEDFHDLACRVGDMLSATDYFSLIVHLRSGKKVRARCLRNTDRILV